MFLSYKSLSQVTMFLYILLFFFIFQTQNQTSFLHQKTKKKRHIQEWKKDKTGSSMALELDLKITQTRNYHTSTANFQIAKDREGPVFLSTEDDDMFTLTAYLKGFKKDNIDIKINEDGTQIMVGGEKQVLETVMIGWMIPRKRMRSMGFRKVFKIPDGVILDSIDANFDQEESILTIVMPKMEKGICGARIEEVKEEMVQREERETERKQAVVDEVETEDDGMKIPEEFKEPEIKRREESDRVVEKKPERSTEKEEILEEVPKKDKTGEIIHEECEEPKIKSMVEPHQIPAEQADQREPETTKTETEKPEAVQAAAEEPKREIETRDSESRMSEEPQEMAETTEGKKIEHHHELEGDNKPPELATVEPTVSKPGSQGDRPLTRELLPPTEETRSKAVPELSEQAKKEDGESAQAEKQKDHGELAAPDKQAASRSSKICAPVVIAGSTLLLSLIVFFIHIIKTKKR